MTDIFISGESDGTSTAAATGLTQKFAIDGFSSGNATSAGNVSLIFAATAVGTGTSTATAKAFLTFSETATSNGISTVAGFIHTNHLLSGSSQGQATVFGNLLKSVELTGSSAGISSTVGNLAQHLTCTASSTGIANAQARATLDFFISGQSDGQTTVNGMLNNVWMVSGISNGTSTTNLSGLDSYNVIPYLQLVKSEIVYSSPAQIVNLIFQVTNSQGERTSSPTIPVITRIFNPQLSLLPNYPQPMTVLDVGLYSFCITMPIGYANLGSFIVDVAWTDPDTLLTNSTFYQIVSRISPSFGGGYSITV